MQVRPDPLAAGVAQPVTVLVRQILDQTSRFERGLGFELGVNPTDLEAFTHLMESGPLSPGELAKRLDLSPAAITTVIDRLESIGHVSRTPDPADRRRLLVTASDKSVKRALGLVRPMVSSLDTVIDEFTPLEQAAIQRYLERLVTEYERHLTPEE